MQEFFENTYIFSLASGSFGELVAYRARCTAEVGAEIFKLLGIGKGEYDFFIEWQRTGDTDMPIIVKGKRNNKPTAVIFVYSERCPSLCFAIEITEHCGEIMKNTFGKHLYGICVSNAIRKLFDASMLQNDGFIGDIIYQTDLIGHAYALLCTMRAAIPGMLAECAHTLAEAASVSLEIGEIGAPSVIISYGGVFVPQMYFGVTAVMAFAAREYSRTRGLVLDIVCNRADPAVKLSFEPAENMKLDFCEYIRQMAMSVSCPVCFYEDGGRFVCEFDTFTVDLGTRGLKHPEMHFTDVPTVYPD